MAGQALQEKEVPGQQRKKQDRLPKRLSTGDERVDIVRHRQKDGQEDGRGGGLRAIERPAEQVQHGDRADRVKGKRQPALQSADAEEPKTDRGGCDDRKVTSKAVGDELAGVNEAVMTQFDPGSGDG